MNQDEQGKKLSRVIAKCWADEGFKKKLMADPAATLKAEGVELPVDLSIKAHANDDKVFHLVIPAKPTDLSDEDLDKVTGGRNMTVGGCEIMMSFCVMYKNIFKSAPGGTGGSGESET